MTRKEFHELEKEVKDMAENVQRLTKNVDTLAIKVDSMVDNVGDLVGSLKKNNDQLINALVGKTPLGSIPLDVHKHVVKSIIWAFGVIVIMSIGAVKLAPILLEKL